MLVHRPDLSLRRLAPADHDELLRDDVLWVERAQLEHDAFVAQPRSRGVEVHYLVDLLLSAASGNALGFTNAWSYWITAWAGNAAIAVGWVLYVEEFVDTGHDKVFSVLLGLAGPLGPATPHSASMIFTSAAVRSSVQPAGAAMRTHASTGSAP